MSDYESHSGKLVPFYRIEGESDKEYFQRAFEDNFKEEYWDEDEYIGEFIYACNMYKKVFYAKDTIFFNVNHKSLDPYDDIQELEDNGDGTYSYFMRFYNGGTCLSEMVEEALENKIK